MTIDWKDLPKNTGQAHIVAPWVRRGCRLFITKLEYTHYKPRTERNELFHLRIGQWQGMQMAVISVPSEEINLAKEVATSLGMGLAENHAMILFGGATAGAMFPATGPQIYHLAGDYQGNEDAECRAIFVGDQAERKAHVMDRIQFSRADKSMVDRCIRDMKLPRLKFRMEATKDSILDMIVAFYDTQAFGFITLCRDEPTSQVYVGAIYVPPDVRRWGIATILIKSALGYCVRFNIEGKIRILCGSAALHAVLDKFPPGRDKYFDVIEVPHEYDSDMEGEPDGSLMEIELTDEQS